MPRARPLTDERMRRLRSAAQLLHRPGRRSPVEVVRHLTGIQAQVLSAAGLALRARTEGLTARRVDRARLQTRSVVLTWAMRGTLHLIAAEDYGWLVPLVVEPRLANAHRRLKQEGLSQDQWDKAIRLIESMLSREGPLTRPEIAERLRRRGIPTEGQAIAHIMWLASTRGVTCHGPDRGRETCFVLVRDWLDRPDSMEPEKAAGQLALRYLTAHEPADPADLAMWSGLRLGDAKRAWRNIGHRLVEVDTTRGIRWTLRTAKAAAPRGLVRLLPSFDEYLLGWKDREVVAGPRDWKAINRGGGWLGPVVVADGRAVGTWDIERSSATSGVRLHPFSTLSPTVRLRALAEAKDVESFVRQRKPGSAR